jgi:hypothetical protein
MLFNKLMEVKLDDNSVCISALIDNSGSMANLNTAELAEGLNKMIKEQCNKEVIFYGGAFNDTFKIFADGINGNDVNITKNNINPDGMTALYTSFARMIKYTGKKLADMTDRRPGKVIFILLSDGEQTINVLRNRTDEDYDYEGHNAKDNLKKLIEEHTFIWKWDFLYLGTNYDSMKAGADLGINPNQCINYQYTPLGSQQVMKACSAAMSRITSNNFNGFNNKERSMAMNVNIDD